MLALKSTYSFLLELMSGQDMGLNAAHRGCFLTVEDWCLGAPQWEK